MVPFRLQNVTSQRIGVDQSKPFSLVKLVGPYAAVCRRYEEILPHGSKVIGSNTSPCRAGSRFLCFDGLFLQSNFHGLLLWATQLATVTFDALVDSFVGINPVSVTTDALLFRNVSGVLPGLFNTWLA